MSDEPHANTRFIDPQSEEPGFFYRPEVIRNILRGFYAICAVLFALDFVFHRHAYVSFEGLWGFYGIFGFVACVALVVVAKGMRVLLWREPSYYDDSADHPTDKHQREGGGH
ncbi:MAG: hypothetical protein Hals2KO_15550 [Halioglobus sp.]